MTTPFEDYFKKYDSDIWDQYAEKEKEDNFISSIQDITDDERGLPAPKSILGGVFDFFSRGTYAAAKYSDVMANEEGGTLAKAWRAIKSGLSEGLNPQERLTFKDVLKRYDPVWTATHQAETEILGFLGDIVVDPINAISFGTGGALKGAVKIVGKGGKIVPLSKPGVRVFKEIVEEVGQESGLTGIRQLETSTQIMQELLEPGIKRAPEVTHSVLQVEDRILRGRVSKAAEQLTPKHGVFFTDYQSVGDIVSGKGTKSLLNEEVLSSLKKRMKDGDEVAESLFDSIVQGSPRIEVSPLTTSYPRNVVQYGTKKGRQIAVLVDPKYITKIVFKRDKVGVHRLFASSTIDPEDLRFMVPDSDEVFDFSQLQNHISSRLARENTESALQASRIKKDQERLTQQGLSVESLIDPGGLKFLGKSAISTEQFKSFAQTLRLPQALKAVKDLPGIAELNTVAKGLRETFGLHRLLERDYPEWIRFRRHIESLRHDALENVEKAYLSAFQVEGTKGTRVLGKKERAEVNEFLASVQKGTKERIEEMGLKNPSFEFGQQVFRDMLSASKLSTEQKSVVVKLQQSYNDMHRLEMQANLTRSYFVNYNPIRYEAIGSVKKYVDLRRWQTGQAIKKDFTPAKAKKFLDPEEALAAGYQPIQDAGRLYAMRFLEHHAGLRRKEWETFIEKTYPRGVPKNIDSDLVRLGEKFIQPRYGEAGRLFFEMFDGINRAFRKSATVVRPAFTTKQIIGNSFQVFAEMGTSALKVFDPTTLADAGLILSGHGNKIQAFTDVFGIKYTGDDLQQLIKKFPVRKNVAIENVGFSTESDIVRKLTGELYTAGKSPGTTTALRGLENLFGKGLFYLQIPALTEDMFRIGTFLGAIKAGNSPHVAMEIVDNALFNYTSGLTQAEQTIRRTVVPFFSFQKFGTELLIRTIGQHPARLGVTTKSVQQFFESWDKIASNEELTEAERSVIPGYLLSQPHTFEKFDKYDPTGQLKATFRTFNNMLFLDVVNFLQTDDNGDVDLEETLLRGALAQLMPFWKVPLEEFVFKKELFSDRALEGVYAGKIGNVDYDKFISNLATFAGLHGGLVGAAAGRALSGLAKFGPTEEIIKDFIDWEEGTDRRTGERTVHVNPWMLHVTTNLLPGLNQAFKTSQQGLTLWDKVLYTGAGIGTIKLDLQAEGDKKVRSARYEFEQKKREYIQYLREGRLNAADIARQDMHDLLEYNEQEVQLWTDPEIRGGFMGDNESGEF